ncbi:hypothetical protein QJQ45_007204 [Haematococcus lacustris]|nr:hypothetical protein QJQ45_007204 [Haematococcus lacustris]
MGIKKLLEILKPITSERHLRSYRGKRVAVDAYAWLYMGAYACSTELFRGTYTDKFVSFCMSRIQLMQKHGIEPVVVFDGCDLPMKNDEQDERRRRVYQRKMGWAKSKYRESALTHLKIGDLEAAEKDMQRCVTVTTAMAKQLIEALKDKGVAFVVAPYEADAQMAYLALNGDVWAVVTEDSDLLAYGCPRVFFKLDNMGNGEEICLANLPLNKGVSFADFSHTMFLEHAISQHTGGSSNVLHDISTGTSGCSARTSKAARTCGHCLPGGIGMADVDVPSAVQQPAAFPTRRGRKARSSQFDLQQAALSDPLAFLGPWLPDSIAQGLAAGDLDPSTLKPYDLAKVYAGASNMPLSVQQALGRMSSSASKRPKVARSGLTRTSAFHNPSASHFHPMLQPAATTAAIAYVTTKLALPHGAPCGHAVPRRHSLLSCRHHPVSLRSAMGIARSAGQGGQAAARVSLRG